MRRLTTLFALILAGALLSCGNRNEKPEVAKSVDTDNKSTVYVPPPIQHLEGTPYWVTQSRNWPAVQEWPVGPDGDYSLDSAILHITGSVIQSFVSGPKGKQHPVMCWFELTARPIPRQLVGYAFNIDSVSFYDPLKKKTLPTLAMLSSERFTEKGVVRTRFANNLATVHSPSLVENQPLNPTIFLTSIEKKTVKLVLPSMNVSFIREFKQPETPTDSLKWGPS